VVGCNSGLSCILLSDCLSSFNSADQGLIDDLRRFRYFRLDWLRWKLQVAALCEYSSHLHVVDDRLKFLISLSHPLRSGGKENLSSTVSAGAWVLDEHDRVGVLERSLPIIDWFIRIQ